MRSQSPSSFCFQVFDLRYVVHVPDAELADVVQRLLPAYETKFLPSDAASKERVFRIHRRSEGIIVESTAHDSNVICATIYDLIDDFEFLLAEAFLSDCSDRVHLHASGCVVGDSAVLALGRSGAGKSSLAAYWTLHGVPVMGDDVVLLNESGEVEPFKRLFKVDPTLLRKLGGDPTETPFWGPGSGEAWYDPAGSGGWAEASSVGLVAVIAFAKGEKLSVRSLSRTDALNVLLHGGLDSGLHGAERFERLAAIVEGVPLLEIQYGDILDVGAFLAARGKS